MKRIPKYLAFALSVFLLLASMAPSTVFAITPSQQPEPTHAAEPIEGESQEQPLREITVEQPPDTPVILDWQKDELSATHTWPDGNTTYGEIATPTSLMVAAASTGAWTEYGRPGHASASGDSVSFAGHPQVPFTTLLYQAANDGDYRILTFHLSEGVSDWHTLEGTGFMFNCGISGGVLNGYAVLFTQSNVGYYKLTNVNVNALASQHFTSIAGVSLIDQKSKPAYSAGTTWYLKLVMSPGTLKVEKYADTGYTQLAETIFATTMNDTSGGAGYGPFGSFIAHDCPSISTSTLQYFNLTIKPNTPPVITAPDVTLNRGAAFAIMDGVSANDAEDGNLTSAITVVSSNVNTQVPGVYQVTYTVSDLAGASVNHTRKVTVLADVLFLVTDAKTKTPIQGVGITMGAPAGALSNTDTSGKSSVAAVPPGTYQWEVTKQHDDYLPLLGKQSVKIDSSSSTVWPMVVPVELTKKYYDAGVELSLSKIGGDEVKSGSTAKYNQSVVFLMTITNNSNQSVIPTVDLKTSEGIVLSGAARVTGKALEPGASETVEIPCKVTSLRDTQSAVLEAAIVQLALPGAGATVPDENPENDTDKAELAIKNIPVVFTKTDSLSKKALDGVEFQISSGDTAVKLKKQDNGSWLAEDGGVTAIVTSGGGKLTVYGLEPGKYSIKETKPLPGYALPSAPWAFEINEDGAAVGNTALTNEPTVFELTKTDKLTKAPLADVPFKVLGKDEKPLKLVKQDGYYVPADKGEEICVTDTNGRIVIKYLPVGSYTLVEQPYAGYIPLTGQKFEVKDAHTEKAPCKLALENAPTGLMLEKTDSTTGKLIDGAVFKLTGPDGKPVLLARQTDGTYRPDAKGQETFIVEKGSATINYLPIGKYTVTEVTAPKGFSLAKPVQFEITDKHSADAPLKVTIADNPLAILIWKTTKDRTPLSGAGFTLTAAGSTKPLTFVKDEKGVYRYAPAGTITTIMVNQSGEALVYGLPEAEYVLEETVVPDGYIPAVPRRIKLVNENDSGKPLDIMIINEPLVKLGFDFDRWFPIIGISLLVLALATGILYFVYQWKVTKTTE